MERLRPLLHTVIDVIVQFDRDAHGRHVAELHYRPRAQRGLGALV